MLNTTGKWNDLSNYAGSYSCMFICEYDNEIDASKYSPELITTYGGHDYWYFNDAVDWQTAAKICKAKGGHLVTIESAEENKVIQGNLKNFSKERIWLGISDIETEGVWKDINNKEVIYTNWYDSEPNNDGYIEDYAEMYGDGTWNDERGYFYNYKSIGFVCEFDNEEKILLGDVNNDGTVNVKDCTYLQKSIAGYFELTAEQKKAADVDGNGKVNIRDATEIQKYAVRRPSVLDKKN